eukprot:gb/GFBE01052255.1/.p1 GENE.gb/GFBE01052255.1/~~gb/GFBE01052255.1/.p1  ORF type:complete len:273 (+),score=29.97 gb/GFBE01052255.1/:1-819(+)
MAECAYLEDGATTIIIRGLPPRATTEKLVCKLDTFLHGKYDFVYVPQTRHRQISIGLGFVNFIDHASAKLAFDFFSKEGQERSRAWTSPRVSQAATQGLGPNLAFFLVSAGPDEIENPYAPQVFQHGIRMPSLADAISQFVSTDLLEKAREDFQKRRPSPERRHAGKNSKSSPDSKLQAKESQPSSSTFPSGVIADTTFGNSSTSSGDPSSSGSRSRQTPAMAGSNGAGMGSGRVAKARRESDDRLRQDLARLGLRVRSNNLPDDVIAIVSL